VQAAETSKRARAERRTPRIYQPPAALATPVRSGRERRADAWYGPAVQDPIVVAGGGLAGLAAATVLAEHGLPVVLFEREPYLGGRVGSWPDRLKDGTPFQMERGFHAFFRNYKNLRALLRRVDPTGSMLLPLEDYPLLGPGGARESFRDLPRITPLNVIELVRRTPSLTLRDLSRVHVPSALEMLRFDPDRTYAKWDERTARSYLDGLRFPEGARRMLFEVFAHSFFNPEDDYSAAELLAMFHFYFLGNPDGLPFDVMRRPFGPAFLEPLAGYLAERGVRIVRGAAVEAVERSSGALVARVGSERQRASSLVLALDVPGLKALVLRSEPALAELTAPTSSLATTARFAVLRIFHEGRAPAHLAPFAGTAGVGILDNISVYERFEDESAAIAAKHGSVVELHAYGLPPGLDETAIRAGLLEGAFAIHPELRALPIREERLLVRADCPAFAPGSHRVRPGVRTAIPGVSLAGDFVKLPFASALMERATTSGMMAANAILAARGLRQEPIRTGPRKGILRPGILRHGLGAAR
jgi:isorenieratene synthase